MLSRTPPTLPSTATRTLDATPPLAIALRYVAPLLVVRCVALQA